jgi:hypothetical protein
MHIHSSVLKHTDKLYHIWPVFLINHSLKYETNNQNIQYDPLPPYNKTPYIQMRKDSFIKSNVSEEQFKNIYSNITWTQS